MSLADQADPGFQFLVTPEAPEAPEDLGPPPLLDLLWILQGLEALEEPEDLWDLGALADIWHLGGQSVPGR